jgi:hypothetical protein
MERFVAQINRSIPVENPFDIAVKDIKANILAHIKNNFEGYCINGYFINEVTRLVRSSQLRILNSVNGVKCQIDVTFEAIVSSVIQGSILADLKYENEKNGYLHMTKGNIRVFAKTNEAYNSVFSTVRNLTDHKAKSLKIRPLVVRVNAPPKHSPYSDTITIYGELYTPQKSVIYKINHPAFTDADKAYFTNRLNVISQLEARINEMREDPKLSKYLQLWEKLIYPYETSAQIDVSRFPARDIKEIVSNGSAINGILIRDNRLGPLSPLVYLYDESQTNEVESQFGGTNILVTKEPGKVYSNILFDYCQHLEMIISMVENYSSSEKLNEIKLGLGMFKHMKIKN